MNEKLKEYLGYVGFGLLAMLMIVFLFLAICLHTFKGEWVILC